MAVPKKKRYCQLVRHRRSKKKVDERRKYWLVNKNELISLPDNLSLSIESTKEELYQILEILNKSNLSLLTKEEIIFILKKTAYCGCQKKYAQKLCSFCLTLIKNIGALHHVDMFFHFPMKVKTDFLYKSLKLICYKERKLQVPIKIIFERVLHLQLNHFWSIYEKIEKVLNLCLREYFEPELIHVGKELDPYQWDDRIHYEELIMGEEWNFSEEDWEVFLDESIFEIYPLDSDIIVI